MECMQNHIKQNDVMINAKANITCQNMAIVPFTNEQPSYPSSFSSYFCLNVFFQQVQDIDVACPPFSAIADLPVARNMVLLLVLSQVGIDSFSLKDEIGWYGCTVYAKVFQN